MPRAIITRAVLTLITASAVAGCAAPSQALHAPSSADGPPAPREVVVIEGFGGGEPLLLGELRVLVPGRR